MCIVQVHFNSRPTLTEQDLSREPSKERHPWNRAALENLVNLILVIGLRVYSSVSNWLFAIAWEDKVFAKRTGMKDQKLQRAIESDGDLNTLTTKVEQTLLCATADLYNDLCFALPNKFMSSAVN